MNRTICLATALICYLATDAVADPPFKPFVTGLKMPESAAIGMDGRVYVTEIGESGKDGDGSVVVIEDGKAIPFAAGMDDPKGIVAYQKWLFVADNTRIWKVDMKGKAEVYVAGEGLSHAAAVPQRHHRRSRTGTAVRQRFGRPQGQGRGRLSHHPEDETKGEDKKAEISGMVMSKVDTIVDFKTHPELNTPNGLAMDGQSFLLLADFGSGKLYRIKLRRRRHHGARSPTASTGPTAWPGITSAGCSSAAGRPARFSSFRGPATGPILLAEGFESAADICLDPTRQVICWSPT